jgi:DnaJ family protein C protein 9
LLNAYEKYGGKFAAIYESVMLSDILEDDDRFRKILDEEIAKGTVESYEAYERENNDEARQKAKDFERKRREDYDKREAKKAASGKAKGKPKAKKSDASGMADLAAMIQQRQKARNGSFFDSLEAKYAPKGGKRASPMDEPPEEAFAATAARKKSKTSGRNKVEDDVEDEEDIAESEEEEAPKPKKRKLQRGKGRAKA